MTKKEAIAALGDGSGSHAPGATDRLKRIQEMYGCSANDAATYLSFRKEGYGMYQSALLAGLADPHDSEEN